MNLPSDTEFGKSVCVNVVLRQATTVVTQTKLIIFFNLIKSF